MGMNLSRMALFMVVMPLARMVPTNIPAVMMGIRILYWLVCALNYYLTNMIRDKVIQENNTKKIWVKERSGFTTFQDVETTYVDFEVKMCDTQLQGIPSGALMNTVMSFMGYVIPLFIQIVSFPLDLYSNPLFKKYMLHKELDHPYKETETRPIESLTPEEQVKKIQEMIPEVWDCKQTGDYQGLFNLVMSCKQNDIQCEDKDCKGWTALMVFAGSPSCPCDYGEKLIKSKKCNVYIQDADGWTALHWAVYHSNCGAIDSLLESCDNKGKLLNFHNKDGKTAIDIAKENNIAQVMDTLKIVQEW